MYPSGYIIVHPYSNQALDCEFTKNVILMLPELYLKDLTTWEMMPTFIDNCGVAGVCTDYPEHFKGLLDV